MTFYAKLRLFEDLLIEGGGAVINIDDAYGKIERIKDWPIVVKLWHQQNGFLYQRHRTTDFGLIQRCLSGQNWEIPLFSWDICHERCCGCHYVLSRAYLFTIVGAPVLFKIGPGRADRAWPPRKRPNHC